MREKFYQMVQARQEDYEGYIVLVTSGIFVVEDSKRLYYINVIDADLNVQRIYLRIMHDNKWINDKRFYIAIDMISEIGKIIGGLLKYYGKNIKK